MRYWVEDETLMIELEENTSIRNTETICFEITLPMLSRIALEGVGDYALEGDYLAELEVGHSGVGHIYAYALELGVCNIISNGVGNCNVNVRDRLNVAIGGPGNVYYKGHPSIESSIAGPGLLINAN
jgi:hypothetical protein